MLIRLVAAATTSKGPDFLEMLDGISTVDSGAVGPIGFVIRGLVNAGTSLPLAHRDLVSALVSPNFDWSAELVALTLLLKSPLILLDLMAAFLIYRVASSLGASTRAGESALFVWLLNPYVTFTVEMWGSPEILPISLTLLATWLIIQGRNRTGAVAFASAIASKLFPAILLVSSFKTSLHSRSKPLAAWQLILGMAGLIGYFLWSSRDLADVFAGFAKYNPQTFIFDEFTISTSTISMGLGTVALAVTWFLIIQLWDWNTRSIIPASLATVSSFLAFYNWPPAALLWPLVFLILPQGSGKRLRGKGIFLLSVGALFVILSNHNAILATRSIFFIPVSYASSFTAVRILEQFFAYEITQVVILPAVRALFAAVAILLAASLHVRNSSTTSPIRNMMQLGN